MNRLTILDRIHKHAEKATEKAWTASYAEMATKMGLSREDIYNKYINEEFKKLESALKLNERLENLLTQYNITKGKEEKLEGNYFWITLRPGPEHLHRFNDFKHLVDTKYITRSCFLSFILSWEQKGETEETMGEGYHCHILALTPNWLKKTQLIKDTKSTFNKFLNGFVPEAFVQVEYVRTVEHFHNINAYLRGYKADGFKETASTLDIPWRKQLGLNNTYGDLEWEGESKE